MRLLALAACGGLFFCQLACASTTVDLERVRGVYSTHFHGIPDSGRICAVISNRRGSPVDWVRLRLASRSGLAERPGRWRSAWLYRGRLEPGESVAVELDRPPVSDQIRLTVHGAGRGRPTRTGRPAVEIPECSERALSAALERDAAAREAPGREIVRMAAPGGGEPSRD
ncbi:MAG: hypothetical protein JRG76_12745 [Deltaproteobacteria bacterium]|nr:hypothetical protein [Deltaproteobacteria bacterium]MBW2415367.1 hypothetical protein [Deltaproteobacteria bacterium]